MRLFIRSVGILCTMLIVMIEVPPDHVITPLAAWFRIGGMSGIADWLNGSFAKSATLWAVWVLAAIAFISFFGVPLWQVFKTRLWMRRSKLLRPELIYPAEANSEAKDSLFRRSWAPLPNVPIKRKVSIHRFFVGVRNPSTEKTLRNVRLVLESKAGAAAPAQILNETCICDGTQIGTVDIQPLGMEYFLIGGGVDETDTGIFHPKPMKLAEYDQLLAELEQQSDYGFITETVNARRHHLLKNDGILLYITAYADDTHPTGGKLTINTRNRIEMFLDGETDVT